MTKAERQIARIEKMENALNQVTAATARMKEALDAFDKIHAQALAISGYLGSENWWQDFEADADGKLPDDLKRGVLSEDGIFGALEDYREALVRMLKTVTAGIKNG